MAGGRDNDAINMMFGYKTKHERIIDAQNRRREYESRFIINNLSVNEDLINKKTEEYNEYYRIYFTTKNFVPLDVAISDYLNARSYRHDIWVDFLNDNSPHGYRFGDIKVDVFCETLKAKFNREIKITNTEKKKTPDILMLDTTESYIIIGDVAVAKSVDAATNRKYMKYYPLANELRANGFDVQHINFIIDESFSNVSDVTTRFKNLDIINTEWKKIERATWFSRSASNIMENSKTLCENPVEFDQEIQKIDRISRLVIPEITIPDEIDDEDLRPPNIIYSEEEIISWIKKQVDKEDPNKYFDNSIDDTKVAFEKLLNKYKEQDYTSPKSTLKVIDNSHDIEPYTNHDLLLNYLNDSTYTDDKDVLLYFKDLLPNLNQVKLMSRLYTGSLNIKDIPKGQGVYGPYQYSRTNLSVNIYTQDLNVKLGYGKKERNIKKKPKTIDPDLYIDSMAMIENSIRYYGSISEKPTFLDESWDSSTNYEFDNSTEIRDIYNYVRMTNGAQMCHSLSNFFHRLMHMRTKQGSKDNIYITPNGSFMIVIPKEHAPISNAKCDIPLIFITRSKRNNPLTHIEYEHKFDSELYTYYISKLCRMDISKLSNWDQAGYKIIAISTHVLSTCPELLVDKVRLIGILTLFLMDCHQKTSEFLDLLKYISFMPFAELSRLSSLIEDKFDLLIKTNLDVWLIHELKDFMYRLSETDKIDAKKPKLRLFNSIVTRESLGMEMSLPSFVSKLVRHSSIAKFIEEVNMLYIIRPKHLYGSQFMDKSINDTVEWNIEYLKEVEDYGDWAVNGQGTGEFPFKSKFCFSTDAILHAQNYIQKIRTIRSETIEKGLHQSPYNSYLHYNCSLRGCTKDRAKRSNITDIHTTSLQAVLEYYKDIGYNDPNCTSLAIACDHILKGKIDEFSMSEKDQRGGGRPIATPTLGTKASLMMIEKPESIIGAQMSNNIIVPGKHKLSEQCETYKLLLSTGATAGLKSVYQLTEDQTKFSENDNTRKYIPYIKNNIYLNRKVRALQLKAIKNLIGREHLVKRIPESIKESKEKIQFLNNDRNGVRAIIGWPQGMLNFISTSIHSIADYWITEIYNKAYGNTIITKGLVHSDDSWVAIACNDLYEFKRFALFRKIAKKLFCLKLNEKKLWGSRYLGELVSNYNINGNVHLSISKVLANSFGNLIYQNWVMDVHNQISSLQQIYRSGANVGTLIMISTILRQQMVNSYQVKDLQRSYLYLLPIELGGYPNNSVFELAVTGLDCHYRKILDYVKVNPNDKATKIILRVLRLSLVHNTNKEQSANKIKSEYWNKTKLLEEYESKTNDDDTKNLVNYEQVIIPSKGEVFSCLKHIMPRSNKVTKTLEAVKSLPYTGNGLEMIITRPMELATALGNLKTQTSSLVYALASEGYTQSSKRLAISQSIQSTGKVIRIDPFVPMTFNELYGFILKSDNLIPGQVEQLEVAFNNENSVTEICESVVFKSEQLPLDNDKRKIINRMPEIEDKFKTISKLKFVLLHIVDSVRNNRLVEKYGDNTCHLDILKMDAELIKRRFALYFKYYTVENACNLIMQQYLTKIKSRLWMQPFVRNDTILNFICDLYGKTIHPILNFRIIIGNVDMRTKANEKEDVETLYGLAVLNEIYDKKFELISYRGNDIQKALEEIDHTKLDEFSYLKYGILWFYYCNNHMHIHKFDSQKTYDQKYEIPQKMGPTGYYGQFVCLVRYGKTVMKIGGYPGNVIIIANRANAVDIITGMHIFVNRNFKYHNYAHKNMWGLCQFWDTDKAIASDLWLNYFGTSATMISSNRGICSIALGLDEHLGFGSSNNPIIAEYYELSEKLRVVEKYVDGRKVRVGSVTQTLNMPNKSYIKIQSNLLEGYSTSKLLYSNVIIDLTLRRYNNISKKDVTDLLLHRVNGLSIKPVINFYEIIAKYFKQSSFAIQEHDRAEDNIVFIQEDITSILPEAIIKNEAEYFTNPEDLTAIDNDFITVPVERVGSLQKHNDLTSSLSRIISRSLHISEIKNFIRLILNDHDFQKWMVDDGEISPEELEERYKTIIDFDELTVDHELYCMVVGNQLDLEEVWIFISIEDLLMDDSLPVIDSYLQNMLNKFKTFINEIYYMSDINKPNPLHNLLNPRYRLSNR